MFHEFRVEETHPLLTLVTMIAPSPDWFVGVHDLVMRDEENWIGRQTVELWPYDAGTEEVTSITFSTGGSASQPHQPISRLDGFPFTDTPHLGTFTFTVLPNELGADHNLDGVVGQADIDIWQQGFGQHADGSALVVDGDADADGDVDGADYLLALQRFGSTIPLPAAAAAVAVPEPHTLGLFLAALVSLTVATRRHHKRR